ncbi:LysR substrate-binding domain-containing protein [Motilimonas sp. KMU-193]|uniref:LysR substrate-binding domain-containing protein n=1 Tax=Motilimonas sp. KMU-193 TaxID=3388668 RepID=UPI00396B0C3F
MRLVNPLTLIALASHPLAQQQQIPFAALMQERFLLREQGSATRMLFESWLQTHLASSVQMASNEAIRVGVSSGMGLAVLSSHVLPAQDQTIVPLDVADFPIESHWYFIARNDRHLSPAALGYLRFAEQHLEACLGKQWARNDLQRLLSALA